MLFNSYTFIIFFCTVLLIYYGARSWSIRKTVLLLASYLFYAAWNPPFVLLLVFSTVVDWFFARGIAAGRTQTGRRLCLVGSLSTNLGLLGYFKYGGFLFENFEAMIRLLGIQVQFAAPDIILPVGISFYTFQTLSYTLDVYFGKAKPWHSFLDYAMYVTFFPQLVAGPIVRAADYLPQCIEPKRWSSRGAAWGLSLMVLGIFEKVAIADGLLAPVVETIYDATRYPGFLHAWCGTFAFAGQIFCDFAGYSTCAIGAAICLGFGLPDNFRFPYAAVGFSDFWKRWHLSLSTWLRDYLYIPLGGNRKGDHRTYQNLMATMLLGGLWHGASWTFVIWGGLHGLFLVMERKFKHSSFLGAIARRMPPVSLGILTFLLVCIAWVFFRAPTFGKAYDMLAAMLGLGQPGESLLRKCEIAKVLAVMASLLGVHWMMRDVSLESVVARAPWWVRSVAIALMLVGIVTLSGEDRAFIYFQF